MCKFKFINEIEKDHNDNINEIQKVHNEIFAPYSKLHIRGGNEDNSKIIFLFLNKNIRCDPSLEPSQ